MNRIVAFAAFVVIFTLFSSSLCAQEIRAYLQKDSVVSLIGKTFINSLYIHNNGAKAQKVAIAIKTPESVQLLSAIPTEIELTPGQAVRVPIKGLINNQMNDPASQILIQVNDLAGQFSKELSFSLFIKGKTQSPVTLYSHEETIVLFSPYQTAHLPFRLVHNRHKPENFTIEVLSFPAGVDQSVFPFPIKLLSEQDTLLTMQVNPRGRWSADQPYQLVVNIRDEQLNIVGTILYKVLVVLTNKRYIDTNLNPPSGYGTSAALTLLNKNQLAKEVRAWGTDSVGKGQLDFHISYINYGNNQAQQLQNSFVSWHNDRAKVRLGTIYDYHELPLYGRGLKVNIGQSDRQWTFWAINGNPNWLGNYNNVWSGTVLSVRYDRQIASLPGGSWSASSSYFAQANIMRAGYLNFATFRYTKSERHSIQLLGGQSVEFARQSGNRAQVFGLSGQLNYLYQGPKLTWQFQTYFSSPTYSGLQKGAQVINSQLFWKSSDKTSLTARVNHTSYDRVSFASATDYSQTKFGNTTAELSVMQTIGQLTLGLRPYWVSQRDQSNPVSQRADAYRVAPSLTYMNRKGYTMSISYDVGMFYDRSNLVSRAAYPSQRVVSTIAAGPFNLWAYIQKGPFFLFDLQNNQPDKMMTASITPTVDFSFFNRKIFGTVGLNYVHDAATNLSRYIAVGRAQADISPTLSVQVSGNATPYSPRPELAYSIYRMEVIKRFGKAKDKHNGQLRMHFFEDINGNGTKDSGESWMDSLLVTVNGNTMVTDAKGAFTYKRIPPGSYQISAISANRIGDPVLYNETITIAKSVRKVVGLARTFRVKGVLRCQISQYETRPCQFDRFGIDVQRDDKVITTISPLPDGTFSTHLTPGDYTLVVHDYGRQPQSVVKTAPFTLTDTGQHPVFNWVIDGNTRAVEIKRFTAK